MGKRSIARRSAVIALLALTTGSTRLLLKNVVVPRNVFNVSLVESRMGLISFWSIAVSRASCVIRMIITIPINEDSTAMKMMTISLMISVWSGLLTIEITAKISPVIINASSRTVATTQARDFSLRSGGCGDSISGEMSYLYCTRAPHRL